MKTVVIKSRINTDGPFEIRFETRIHVDPNATYVPARDARDLQLIRDVVQLVETISNHDESNLEGDLEQRQGELLRLLNKVFRQKKYTGARDTIMTMFQRIQHNPLFACLDIIPELRQMV